MDYNQAMRVPVPGHPRWEVDERGFVYRDGRYIHGCVNNGYVKIYFDGKTVMRGHIVCLAFHGPKPECLELRHKDDVKLNDEPDNLAWGTRLENCADRKINGTHANCRPPILFGADNPRWGR
jgi:hypothetical protein